MRKTFNCAMQKLSLSEHEDFKRDGNQVTKYRETTDEWKSLFFLRKRLALAKKQAELEEQLYLDVLKQLDQ